MATSAGACGSPPADATTFAYDERGNRTGTTWPSERKATFTYDQANSLVRAPDLDADLLVPGEVLPTTGPSSTQRPPTPATATACASPGPPGKAGHLA